ncbi:putative bifunctional protein: NMN adenylyltransferase/NUDIX hydrolase [Yersinia phage JC221]|nr:putative bifunctional protein: NMN adenylyltransferase/NUDIX hydrolase [Yersinia phage JC221]
MKYKYDKAVVIGRFQPFHNGHVKMVSEALKESKQVYILLGSSNAYPNVINPLTAHERKQMILRWIALNLKSHETECIKFAEIPDSLYNDEKWKSNVRLAIDEQAGDKVAIYGFYKDSESYWLNAFGWEHRAVKPELGKNGGCINATDLRKVIFSHKDGWEKEISPYVPESTIGYIDHWMASDNFWRIEHESRKWESEIEKFSRYPYPEALNCCTADSVVVCNNHLLVIRRKFAPGKDALALPGGHKNANETFLDCAIRELLEEVRIKVPEKVIRGSIRNSMLFDHPRRSAYFSKPTVAQYIKLEPNPDGSLPRIMGGADDAADAFWMPLHDAIRKQNQFFDDHFQIITAFTGI